MDVIVRTVVKGILPFILLLGIAIMFHGHLTPGGSFPGGAVVASAFALVAVTIGIDEAESKMGEKTVHALEAVAVIVVALVIIYEAFIRQYAGLAGMFGLWNSPTVLTLNVVGGVMVMGTLTLVVFLVLRE
jgi:multicomponent Na+:H+ antiporter subunit B